jgi:hypothetical protein
MAIDYDNTNSMYHLGFYYHYIEKNYDQMKKYYLMAIDRENYNAAVDNLSNYLNTNPNKLYDDFELYYPYLNIINISNIRKSIIKNYYLKNQNNKIRFLPLDEDIKTLLLEF